MLHFSEAKAMENQQSHYLSTEATQEGFEFWSQQPFVPNELKDGILSASILFIPSVNFREGSGPTFPVNTTFLFDYFKELLPDNLLVDIAVSDDEYRELALYNNYIRLGKFLVKEVALPIFINILSGFISDNIIKKDELQHPVQIVYNIKNDSHDEQVFQNILPSSHSVDEHPKGINEKHIHTHRKRSEAHVPKYSTKHVGPSHVEFEVTVEDSTGRKKSFHYEGPATEAHKITHDIKALWDNEARTNQK